MYYLACDFQREDRLLQCRHIVQDELKSSLMLGKYGMTFEELCIS